MRETSREIATIAAMMMKMMFWSQCIVALNGYEVKSLNRESLEGSKGKSVLTW
jgi:hypothetical protein